MGKLRPAGLAGLAGPIGSKSGKIPAVGLGVGRSRSHGAGSYSYTRIVRMQCAFSGDRVKHCSMHQSTVRDSCGGYVKAQLGFWKSRSISRPLTIETVSRLHHSATNDKQRYAGMEKTHSWLGGLGMVMATFCPQMLVGTNAR